MHPFVPVLLDPSIDDSADCFPLDLNVHSKFLPAFSFQVEGSITYNGRTFKEFIPLRTATYVEQSDTVGIVAQPTAIACHFLAFSAICKAPRAVITLQANGLFSLL